MPSWAAAERGHRFRSKEGYGWTCHRFRQPVQHKHGKACAWNKLVGPGKARHGQVQRSMRRCVQGAEMQATPEGSRASDSSRASRRPGVPTAMWHSLRSRAQCAPLGSLPQPDSSHSSRSPCHGPLAQTPSRAQPLFISQPIPHPAKAHRPMPQLSIRRRSPLSYTHVTANVTLTCAASSHRSPWAVPPRTRRC